MNINTLFFAAFAAVASKRIKVKKKEKIDLETTTTTTTEKKRRPSHAQSLVKNNIQSST